MVLETLFSLIFLAGIIFLLLWYVRNNEGFEDVGTTVQAELPLLDSPPTDSPGASTNNPTISLPQAMDVQATIDSLNNMNRSIRSSNVNGINTQNIPNDVSELVRNLVPYPTMLNDLNYSLNNISNSKFTLNQLSELRAKFDKITRAYANLTGIITQDVNPPSANIPNQIALTSMDQSYGDPSPMGTMNQAIIGTSINTPTDTTPSVASAMTDIPQPTTVASIPGKITLPDLKNLRDRIDNENVRIQSLRSSSPTITAKQGQLEKLNTDIDDMINKVERRELDINEVPINDADANAFLKSLTNEVVPTTLITPSGICACIYGDLRITDGRDESQNCHV